MVSKQVPLGRPILVPSEAATVFRAEQSKRVLARKIRLFGYVPNVEQLLPGDVILVTGAGPVPGLIRYTQERGGFHSDHARWTHIALHIDNDMIIEAAPWGGIRIDRLEDMTFGREVLVRRLEGLKPEDRFRVAIQALAGLRRRYSLPSMPRLAWQAWREVLWRKTPVHGVTICSTVARDAYITGPQIDLFPGQTGVIWPADLSMTPVLSDVPVDWVKVVA